MARYDSSDRKNSNIPFSLPEGSSFTFISYVESKNMVMSEVLVLGSVKKWNASLRGFGEFVSISPNSFESTGLR